MGSANLTKMISLIVLYRRKKNNAEEMPRRTSARSQYYYFTLLYIVHTITMVMIEEWKICASTVNSGPLNSSDNRPWIQHSGNEKLLLNTTVIYKLTLKMLSLSVLFLTIWHFSEIIPLQCKLQTFQYYILKITFGKKYIRESYYDAFKCKSSRGRNGWIKTDEW